METKSSLTNPYLTSSLSLTTSNTLLAEWTLDTTNTGLQNLGSSTSLTSSNLLSTHTSLPEVYTNSSLNTSALLTSNELLRPLSTQPILLLTETTYKKIDINDVAFYNDNQEIIKEEDERKEVEEDEMLNNDSEAQLVDYSDLKLRLKTIEDKIVFPDETSLLLGHLDQQQLELLRIAKIKLVRLASVSMLLRPDLMNPADATRQKLIKACDEVAFNDPEFVLKVALYTRQELHVRSVSNLMLAYASINDSSKPLLGKYFSSTINLPSDLMETADFALSLASSLPTCLRKAMASKFGDFDEYQLAKYNKNSNKNNNKAKKKNKDNDVVKDDQEDEKAKRMTLKCLIRLLHISSPPNFVMAILGKKYPECEEAFRSARLPGFFDPSMAGKRMKLATPLTWETQISTKGNLASVWSSLITARKLPYMALLRNLRNLCLVNLDAEVSKQVLQYLTNIKAVSTCKIFPFRFLVASEALKELEKDLDKVEGYVGDEDKHRGKLRSTLEKNCSTVKSAKSNVEIFSKGIERAMTIASDLNVPRLSNRTLIICSLTYESLRDSCSSKKGLVPVDYKMSDLVFLAAVMVASGCENVDLWIVYENDKCFEVNVDSIDLKKLVKSTRILRKIYEETTNEAQKSFSECLRELRQKSINDCTKQYSRCVYLHCDKCREGVQNLENWANMMRIEGNKDLLCFSINVGEHHLDEDHEENEKNMRINGFSEAVFHCLSDCDSNQIDRIQCIDRKFGLINNRNHVINQPLVANHLIERKIIRVFISSTFVDMHGERDLMHNFVLPELQRRHFQTDITCIDLRWGVITDNNDLFTNTNMEQQRSIVLACIEQVEKSDLVVAILGSRHGWRPDKAAVMNNDKERVIETQISALYEENMSLTELEIRFALANNKKLLCFIRDDRNIEDLPETFVSEPKYEERLEDLKKLLISQNVVVMSEYKAKLAFKRNVSLMIDLDDLALALLESLDKAIQNVINENNEGNNNNDNHNNSKIVLVKTLMDRPKIQTEIFDCIQKHLTEKKGGLIEITGQPGIGVTSLLSKVTDKLIKSKTKPIFLSIFVQNNSDHLNELFSKLQVLCGMKSKSDEVMEESTTMSAGIASMLRWLSSNLATVIVIIVDGLESRNAANLEFVPHAPWPDQVLMLISTHNNSNLARQVKERRQLMNDQSTLITVPELSMTERKNFARDYLLRSYGKRLDENLMNNQLMSVVNKSSSGNIGFLKQILDDLAKIKFDQLEAHLRSLPESRQRMFENLIESAIENSSEHLVSSLLQLLLDNETIGIKEEHLMSPKLGLTSNSLQLAVVINILSKDVITIAGNVVTLKNDSTIKRVVRKHTINVGRDQRNLLEAKLIGLLKTDYYQKSKMDRHTLMSLLQKYQRNTELEEIICSVCFIQLCFEQKMACEIIKILRNGKKSAVAFSYLDFIQNNLDDLQMRPNLTTQMALNSGDPLLISSAKEVLADNYVKQRLALPPITIESSENKKKNLIRAQKCFEKGPKCVCKLDQNSNVIALGMIDGSIHLIDITSLLTTSTFLGHNSSITAMTSTKSVLISGSKDGEMSIWDLEKKVRIHRSFGDQMCVSSIVASRNSVATATFGGMLTFWTPKYNESEHYRHDSPINCIAFHPLDEDQVFIGDWKGRIVCINAVHLKRNSRLGLQKHGSSVKNICFDRQATTLMSSDINNEVRLYDLTEGALMRFLRLQHQINCIRSSEENNFVVACNNGLIHNLALMKEPQIRRITATNHLITAITVIDKVENEDEFKFLIAFEEGQVALMKNEKVLSTLKVSDKSILAVTNKDEFVGFVTHDNHVHIVNVTDDNCQEIGSIQVKKSILEAKFGNNNTLLLLHQANYLSILDLDKMEIRDCVKFDSKSSRSLGNNNTLITLSNEGHLTHYSIITTNDHYSLRKTSEFYDWPERSLNFLAVIETKDNQIVVLAEEANIKDSSVVFILKFKKTSNDNEDLKDLEVIRSFKVFQNHGRATALIASNGSNNFICFHKEKNLISVWSTLGTELAWIKMNNHSNNIKLYEKSNELLVMFSNENNVDFVNIAKAVEHTNFDLNLDLDDLLVMDNEDDGDKNLVLINDSRLAVIKYCTTNEPLKRDRVIALYRATNKGSVVSVTELGHISVYDPNCVELTSVKLNGESEQTLFVKASIMVMSKTKELVVALASEENRVYLTTLRIKQDQLIVKCTKSLGSKVWREIIDLTLMQDSKVVYVAVTLVSTNCVAKFKVDLDEKKVLQIMRMSPKQSAINVIKTLLSDIFDNCSFKHLEGFKIANTKNEELNSSTTIDQWFTCANTSNLIMMGDTNGQIALYKNKANNDNDVIKVANDSITDLLMINNLVLASTKDGSLIIVKNNNIVGLYKNEVGFTRMIAEVGENGDIEVVAGTQNGKLVRLWVRHTYK